MPRPSTIAGLALGALVALGAGSAAAQPTIQSTDLRARGRVLYVEHCASCHGTSGRGDGPAADSLRRQTTDLTGFSRANGGVFPAGRIRRSIDGRGVPSHGSVEMPVWGTVFKATAPPANGRSVQERIDAIVAYLESIQERVGQE